ncbi:hypothetical protein QL285_033215 [Trifolium repens]|nr:hypothetical protein QL285_033215 [Trifolium repens]
MGNGRMKTLSDKFQLVVHLQTVNAKAEKQTRYKETCKSHQIWNHQRFIKRILQISTDLYRRSENLIAWKVNHTRHQPYIGGTRSNASTSAQHLTTTPPHHLHLKSIATATNMPNLDLSPPLHPSSPPSQNCRYHHQNA